jgi:hypothetical protein
MTRSIRTTFTSAILIFGAVAIGCGDDDDDTDTPGNMDGSVLLDGTVPTSDGSVPVPSGPYTGKVVVSTDINMTVAGKKVWLFNSENATKIGDPQTSASDGKVTFASRAGTVGTFVEGGGDYQDTWNYPPARKGEEDLIRLGTKGAAFAVPGLTGYVTNQEASPVAGSVLWHNPTTGKDEFVGCATLEENAGVKDVRYFKDNLPTTLATRSAAQGTVPPKGGTRDTPQNDVEAGKFFAGNVSAGLQTLVIKIAGVEVGRRTMFIIPRSAGTEIFPSAGAAGVKSNLSLGSVYVNGTSNPTPATCM